MYLFIQELQDNPRYFFAVFVTVVVSICVHELCHGITAVWCGDRTPIESGHMTVNPVVHMGLMSFILLLVAGIAWGSMPVDPRRMRGRYDPALVAVAGPLSNVLMAAIALTALAFNLPRSADEQTSLQFLLGVFGTVNIELAIFNLVPIPPLDGSRVLANLSQDYARLMSHLYRSGGTGFIFLLVFMFAGYLIFPAAGHAAAWYVHLIAGQGGR
ncbi:MAG TPA: site-2 protease family protein [Tepidisphaeraceae bacterium]|nr:site-2 protease family protein [Tepidisphaeraceae bacterium]